MRVIGKFFCGNQGISFSYMGTNFQPWATHKFDLNPTNRFSGSGNIKMYSGNYFADREDALEDFSKRCITLMNLEENTLKRCTKCGSFIDKPQLHSDEDERCKKCAD